MSPHIVTGELTLTVFGYYLRIDFASSHSF